MSGAERAQRELDGCLRALDTKDYYNGGQTVVDRYPRGSEERARLLTEAAFWQAELIRLGSPPVEDPS